MFRFGLNSTVFLINRWLILRIDFIDIDDFWFRRWFFENFDFDLSDLSFLIRHNAFSRSKQRLFHDIQFLFDNIFFYIRSVCLIENV